MTTSPKSKVAGPHLESTTLPNISSYDEERIPFDDVMRTLLKAKPQHKPAVKPVKALAKKK